MATVLFPLVHRGIVRLPVRALWPAVLAAFAVIWTVPLATQLLPETYRYWAIWVFPLARLPEFVTGMLLALIVRAGRWPTWFGVRPAVLLAAAAYVGCRLLPEDLRLVAALAPPLALLVGAVAAADVSGRSTRWRKRWLWLLVLSEISYAFYLVHSLVLRVVLRLAGTSHSVLAEVGIAVASLAVTLCGSWLLYRFVERPVGRLLRPRPAAPSRAPLQLPAAPLTAGAAPAPAVGQPAHATS